MLTYKPAMQRLAAILCAAMAAPSFAATHKVPADDPIATIQVPDKWATKQLGEGIEVTSPDAAVSFVVTPVEGTKVNESVGEVMRYLRNRDGITVEADSIKNEKGKLNGLETQNVSWKGKDKKGDVQIRFLIVTVGEKKPLILAYWCSPAAEKKHDRDLKKMLQSVKPT
jgi:hypothetical protein